jgi:hypothetical protein
VSVPFHETWGDRGNEIENEKADILALLEKEIQDTRNWKASIPANNKLHVTIKTITAPVDTIVVHPFGVLTFSERLVPLNLEINKFGNKVPKDASSFEIKTTGLGLVTNDVREQFAPANFIVMKDEEKLARPSFEQMKSGFEIISSSALQTSQKTVDKSVDYEFSYLREKRTKIKQADLYQYPKGFFKANTKAGAISKSTLSFVNNRISVNAPLPVQLTEDQFAIANVFDMKLHQADMVELSYSEAQQRYNNLVREKPEMRDQVQVVSHYELNHN